MCTAQLLNISFVISDCTVCKIKVDFTPSPEYEVYESDGTVCIRLNRSNQSSVDHKIIVALNVTGEDDCTNCNTGM